MARAKNGVGKPLQLASGICPPGCRNLPYKMPAGPELRWQSPSIAPLWRLFPGVYSLQITNAERVCDVLVGMARRDGAKHVLLSA